VTTIYSNTPAYAGVAEAGYSRAGVYTSHWEVMFTHDGQELTRYVANFNVTRDSTTGHRNPSYSDTETIVGILVERGQTMPRFAGGVACLLDGVLFTVDEVNPLDKIYLASVDKYYRVDGVEEKPNPESLGGGFAYRICQLSLMRFHS
jgi:hypothetical protein